MVLKVLAPAMEHTEQTDVGSETLRVARDFEHGRGAGAEEQVVEQALVLEHKCREFMRQREDNMEVRHRQQLRAARGQPLGACVSLALGAVRVAAGVVGDGLMTAATALIAMTAQSRSAAAGDGLEHLTMLPGQM